MSPREHNPTERQDGDLSLTALEADIAAKAPAARRALVAMGAEDLADMLGIAS